MSTASSDIDRELDRRLRVGPRPEAMREPLELRMPPISGFRVLWCDRCGRGRRITSKQTVWPICCGQAMGQPMQVSEVEGDRP